MLHRVVFIAEQTDETRPNPMVGRTHASRLRTAVLVCSSPRGRPPRFASPTTIRGLTTTRRGTSSPSWTRSCSITIPSLCLWPGPRRVAAQHAPCWSALSAHGLGLPALASVATTCKELRAQSAGPAHRPHSPMSTDLHTGPDSEFSPRQAASPQHARHSRSRSHRRSGSVSIAASFIWLLARLVERALNQETDGGVRVIAQAFQLTTC